MGVIRKEGREQHLGNNLGNDSHLSLSLLFLLENHRNEPDHSNHEPNQHFMLLGQQGFVPIACRRKMRNLKSQDCSNDGQCLSTDVSQAEGKNG